MVICTDFTDLSVSILRNVTEAVVLFFNPFQASGPVHHYHLDESISSFSSLGLILFIFTVFFTEVHVNKQCKPCSNATFCGV